MELEQSSIVYLVSTFLCFVVCFMAWERRIVVGALEMCALLIDAGFWSFCLFIESACTTFESKLLWSKLSYFFVTTAPVIYLFFIIKFVGYKPNQKTSNYLFLFVVPIITVLLVWTNDKHHLMWGANTKMTNGSPIIVFERGFWFWIGVMVYSYFILFLATLRLFLFLIRSQNKFKFKGLLMMAAALFPWVFSLLFSRHVISVGVVDLTPIYMVTSAILFTFGFLYTGFFDMIPIARETLVETLPDGIVALDGMNRVQDINKNAKLMLGLETGKNVDIDIRNNRQTEPTLTRAVLSDEKDLVVCLGEDADQQTYHVMKQEIKSPPGSRLIIIRNISDQVVYQNTIKAGEKKYRDLYNTYRLISDNMTDMVWAKDLDKRFIFVNKSICDNLLKANDTDEPIDKDYLYFYERERAKNPDNGLWHTYGEQSDASDDFIIKTRKSGHFDEHVYVEGVAFDLDVRKAPVFNENGEMVGVVGSARDVTKQKKIEKDLYNAMIKAEESDRLKSAFLANMSHEIRTPMNTILGFISILGEQDIEEKERTEYLRIVKESGERLLNTINDIIDISKIEAGQVSTFLSDFDLADLVSTIYTTFRKQVESKGLLFIRKFSLPDELSYVHSDKEKLYSIFANLINNAIKFTPKGYVELFCTLTDTRFELYVKDTGIGIPQDKHHIIFERFIQADVSHQRPYEGSGLGLSITKAYVEMLDGNIWLESQEGKGSTFFVSLPMKQALSTDEEELRIRQIISDAGFNV